MAPTASARLTIAKRMLNQEDCVPGMAVTGRKCAKSRAARQLLEHAAVALGMVLTAGARMRNAPPRQHEDLSSSCSGLREKVRDCLSRSDCMVLVRRIRAGAAVDPRNRHASVSITVAYNSYSLFLLFFFLFFSSSPKWPCCWNGKFYRIRKVRQIASRATLKA